MPKVGSSSQLKMIAGRDGRGRPPGRTRPCGRSAMTADLAVQRHRDAQREADRDRHEQHRVHDRVPIDVAEQRVVLQRAVVRAVPTQCGGESRSLCWNESSSRPADRDQPEQRRSRRIRAAGGDEEPAGRRGRERSERAVAAGCALRRAPGSRSPAAAAWSSACCGCALPSSTACTAWPSAVEIFGYVRRHGARLGRVARGSATNVGDARVLGDELR